MFSQSYQRFDPWPVISLLEITLVIYKITNVQKKLINRIKILNK